MLDKELVLAMTRLGYRPMNGFYWAKPVANSLLTIHEEWGKILLITHFIGANGQRLIWSENEIKNTEEAGGYEKDIARCEYETRLNSHIPGNFGFLTKEQEAMFSIES